uniref:SJCHGC08900 protein n=1 Tax=Schistosoma japonicum TaxID=6182 RepID=Q5DAW3_SCHJA|nr:SJCHGC08900 protein [Schistosoma japonicum]
MQSDISIYLFRRIKAGIVLYVVNILSKLCTSYNFFLNTIFGFVKCNGGAVTTSLNFTLSFKCSKPVKCFSIACKRLTLRLSFKRLEIFELSKHNFKVLLYSFTFFFYFSEPV